MRFARSAIVAVTLAMFAGVTGPACAKDPIVGGAPMSAKKTIVENASASKDHTTLVAAVKAAGLVDTLGGPGPFTVFAPNNAAFKKLPPGSVVNLMKAENKTQLTAVLTYHVVPGLFTAKDIDAQIKAGGGKATLKTVQGEPLTVERKGKSLLVIDGKGDTALVTVPNVLQSNGVIHVINTVMLP